MLSEVNLQIVFSNIIYLIAFPLLEIGFKQVNCDCNHGKQTVIRTSRDICIAGFLHSDRHDCEEMDNFEIRTSFYTIYLG